MSNLANRLLRKIAQPPSAAASANVRHEIGEHRFAVGRVRHLRMKLHPVERPRPMLHRGKLARVRRRERQKIARDAIHLIAVAHPNLRLARHIGKQFRRVFVPRVDRAMGPAELPRRVALHFSAEHLAHQLHPVADAQHRNTQIKNRRITLRRLPRHTRSPARPTGSIPAAPFPAPATP